MKTKGIKKFCRENGIELLVLFGSAAADAEQSHDIDIAVKLKKGSKLSKLDLIYRLDDFFSGKQIDIVVLTSDTDPLLLSEIFFKGTCLFEEKEGLFMEEKLRAWKIYLDTEKIRKMRNTYLKNFVRKASDVS